jgi:hypothetical protein
MRRRIKVFCEAEQTLFASFSGKRRLLVDKLVAGYLGFDAFVYAGFSAKQNKRFLLLFLEKEENH